MTPSNRLLSRFVDLVAAGLVAIFTFALALPGRRVVWHAFLAEIATWLVFGLTVGLLWWLYHGIDTSTDEYDPFVALFHVPFLASLLLLTIPDRMILGLIRESTRDRRLEFLHALGWHSILIGVAAVSLGALLLVGDQGRRVWHPPRVRAVHRARARLYFGAALLAFVTGAYLPETRGLSLFGWFLLPALVSIERGRLDRDQPQS